MFRNIRFALFSLCLALPASLSIAACSSTTMIPGTEIPDTPDTRLILETLERYRKSFVQRDAATILAIADRTYHDESGTDDPKDDVNYSELGSVLRRRMSQIDSVRFTIDYIKIHIHGDRGVVQVWIDASFRLKPLLDSHGVPRPDPDFTRLQDFAEFELLREGDHWLVTSGL